MSESRQRAAQLDRLLHPDEARAIVLANVRPLEPERVPIEAAGDRILAEPLIADVSLPPFPAATMDGYAVIHDDRTTERRVLGSGFAGDDPDIVVVPGTAAKIMTGAPVPSGADAVVPVENTSSAGGMMTITRSQVRHGDNIREIGADLRAGDLLIDAGTLLGPAEVGLLASLGHAEVLVGRRPRVAVISTGNELVAPGETPGPGQIRDSNRFSLAIAARRAGAEVVVNRHIRDEEDDLREGLRAALAEADVVLTSGGVSMGDRDLVKALLGEMAIVHFQKLFMKPGKPLNFATVGDKLMFGLPGNPVSCLVGFQMFVRPALQVMQSASPDAHPTVPVVIEHDIRPSDRIEYQRAVVTADANGCLRARNTGPQMSARLMSFVGSNAFLVVQPREEVYPAGSTLAAILIGPPAADATGQQ
jgi:molybdenum cofactor synthesis domain-containing protein